METKEIKYNNNSINVITEAESSQNVFVNMEFMRYYQLKQHITDTAYLPTSPRNFFEQIQFFDDGINKKLYLYINNAWVSVTLT